MTSASEYEDHTEQVSGATGRRSAIPVMWTAATAALVAILAAGCGASNGPGVARSRSNTTIATSTSRYSSSKEMTQALDYTRCMRNHGVPVFPEPTTYPGGGVAYQFAARGSRDLDRNSPAFEAAEEACRSLSLGGEQPPAASAQKLAAELTWAACMRSHGLPGFPDPNAQGAFDSSRFDDSSPLFQAASKACGSVEPAGPISAVPGHG